MKKLLLLYLFLPVFATAQTVPNGNFEDWVWMGWFEDPEFWTTDNTELQYTVTKDNDAYEGEFAMRVTAVPMGVGDYGEATTLLETSLIPEALNFYAKSEVENGAVSVEIIFLDGDVEVYSANWFGTLSMNDYTLISIPLNTIEPVMTHARIKVSAEVGDLVPGTAWISIDAMEFGEPVGVEKTDLSPFKIYPNPASEYLTIQSAGGLLGTIQIFDAQGKMVVEKRITDSSADIDVREFSPGVYLVRNDRSVKSSRFVVK